MDILVHVFLLTVYASLTASIVALIVICIKKILGYHISVRLHHALWFLVIIRLLIPIIPESRFSMFNILSALNHNSLAIVNKNNVSSNNFFNYDFFSQKQQLLKKGASDDNKLLTNDNENTNSKVTNSKNEQLGKIDTKSNSLISYFLKIISCIWAAGSFAVAITFILITIKVIKKAAYFDEETNPETYLLFKECKQRMKVNRKIPICICNSLKNPCIVGVVNPKIYIPKSICTIDKEQLIHIFLHELSHYKRMDLFYNLLGTFAIIIHWFNPVVWFVMKKMKLDREIACDACVLEILGEDEIEAYGMTLIKSSKLFSNRDKQLQLAISFETKNQIKRRINMIKRFKKGSYKVTLAAVICGVIAASVTLTNAVSIKRVNAETDVSAKISTNEATVENKFLIDAPLKSYDNLKKTKNIMGYNFKLPDFMPTGYNFAYTFQVLKVSGNENALKIYFDGNDKNSSGYSIQVFKSNPIEVLKLRQQIRGAYNIGIGKEAQPDFSEEPLKLGNISGKNIIEKYILGDTQVTVKYFVWQSEGVWYSINYDEAYEKKQETSKSVSISNENLEKIVASMKYPEEAKNIDYFKIPEKELSTEIGVMEVYDKEDLQKATELLGFTPKLPVNVKCNAGDIITRGSGVGIAYGSDIENKKIIYELNTFYDLGKDNFTFTESKINKNYEDIKKNGYVTFNSGEKDKNQPQQFKAETLNLKGKEVYKYETYYQDEQSTKIYTWEEDGYYCELAFFTNGINNMDEIVQKFVDEKAEQ